MSVRFALDPGGPAGGGGARLEQARSAVEAVFERWDRRFSLYRADSELSRLARGEIRLTGASRELRDAYTVAIGWRQRTGGVFTPHRGDGVIDLSGVVKALALAAAGDVLAGLGVAHWSINAGGDILTRGHPGPGVAWSVAVVDPGDRKGVLANLSLAALPAIATSGSAERGEHIWTPFPGGALPFHQVSVLAADIVTADVLATTIVAGGEAALDDCTRRYSVEVLAVTHDGQLLATPGLRR
ncbi:FAD:protein FMN transferase [Glaciibacter sp. 2TAF33]|uniref:FAD:protein FMN transferase n=1 Tax=Glaciibacter sp. 2TAF33 TaxID=3233015 RepID=UPI003F8D9825